MGNKKENVFINIQQRLFYLSDNIGNETMGNMCFNLLSLLQSDDEKESKEKDFIREPVKLYINSFGGGIYDMWALIDIIEKSKTPIYTYCTGYAMSSGFIIFLAGHQRFASLNATLLYHQSSNWIRGNFEFIKSKITEMTLIQNNIEKYILDKTKINKSQLEEVRERQIDWYIHSDEFINLGLVNKII